MAFHRLIIVLTTLTSWLSLGPALGAEPVDKDAIKQAVQLAIPYLQNEGAAWIEQRGCVSCHQVPAMLWSLSAAQQNGFNVDADRLQGWQDWATQAKSFVGPAQKADVDVAETLSSNIDTINGLLLARQHGDGGWGWISDEPSDALATGMALYAIRKTANSPDSIQAAQAATKYLTSTQGSDGSWSVPGTKQKTRDKSTPTSNYWGTAWAVVGLLE